MEFAHLIEGAHNPAPNWTNGIQWDRTLQFEQIISHVEVTSKKAF
jgi:hypothetical protein